MVVQSYPDDNDYDAVYEAFDLCERICDEVIGKMHLDKYEAACMVVKDFRLDEVSAVQIQNTRERYAGVRYSFTTRAPFGNEIDTRNWRL